MCVNCPARLTLHDNTTVTKVAEHPHPASATPAENCVHVAKQTMKRKAGETDLPTKHLVADAVGPLSLSKPYPTF